MYKLFLVDDEIWVIIDENDSMEELGFDCLYDKALEKIALLKPDAVITDIRMASLKLLDLCIWVKNDRVYFNQCV